MLLGLIRSLHKGMYLAPITAFGYCFLVNDVIDQGLCTENDINQKFWAHLLSVMVCDLRESLINRSFSLT